MKKYTISTSEYVTKGNILMTWELFNSGIDSILPKEAVMAIKQAKKPLSIKFGADPSAPDLHLGHMVVLNKLRVLQDMGHRVQFLIGDFTAMIGDPTGKSETRKTLTNDEVAQNAQTYQDQVFKILDPSKTMVVYNSEWLSKLTSVEMIQLMAHYTVARMLERDDFSNRFKSQQSISVHEFLYPLLQGYDSVVLKSDVEIGGTDQTFNLLMGRHLQKEYGCPGQQAIVTVPILEGLDGVKKMSKSLNNHIALLDSPKDILGKTMSIPDTQIGRYFLLLTDVDRQEIANMEASIASQSVNPRDLKLRLAKQLVTTLHTIDEANRAAEEFAAVFSKGHIPEDIPNLVIKPGEILGEVLVQSGEIPSKKEFRRMIEQGAISLDGEKISDVVFVCKEVKGQVLKMGKRRFYKWVTDD